MQIRCGRCWLPQSECGPSPWVVCVCVCVCVCARARASANHAKANSEQLHKQWSSATTTTTASFIITASMYPQPPLQFTHSDPTTSTHQQPAHDPTRCTFITPRLFTVQKRTAILESQSRVAPRFVCSTARRGVSSTRTHSSSLRSRRTKR
jgi:hypothetical protein